MLSQEIRKSFIQYFFSQGHEHVPSSPVYPMDDPTILFTNAGMNQFKDVFLGRTTRSYSKAVSAQKCIRAGGKHNDLDNVGHTKRHLTFFEMLGNFSFGDYFKEEAIAYAWDVTLHLFAFDKEKIWASIYKDDEQSFELWQKYLPKERIVRFGEEENFWSMGEVGPCGPCSELLYDRGKKYGSAATPLEDITGERFCEFWNLVFMESERNEDGSLTSLPKKSIDTGVGLERVVSLRMGVDSIFHTDILGALINKIEKMSHVSYQSKSSLAPAFHVIADHIRALGFSIADGAIPGNSDRGYVLRKILRRAVRYGKNLGFTKPFLSEVAIELNQLMGEDYPELAQALPRMQEILTTEEESFFQTLRRGGNLLQDVLAASKKKKEISGEDAFKLKDTYGLPIEEILLVAKDHHLPVDLKRFNELEEKAKELSRSSRTLSHQHFAENLFTDFRKTHKETLFLGYEKDSAPAYITAIIKDGTFCDEIAEGESGMILLDQTPFYAEMGGQIGDSGTITGEGASFTVHITKAPFPGVVTHMGIVESGSFKKGEKVSAAIDQDKRRDIEKNHTATHLLHWALEQLLGPHIKQAGSLVAADRLRFDFTHHKALSFEEIKELERLINEKICTNREVKKYELPFEKASDDPQIKQLFGEKYEKVVRVIDIDFSKELCGGTHIDRLGSIGFFTILKETGIAAGVRRIEAVTGSHAIHAYHNQKDQITKMAEKLKCSTEKVVEKLDNLQEQLHDKNKELKKLKQQSLKQLSKDILQKKISVDNAEMICEEVELSFAELPTLADYLLASLSSGIVIIGAKEGSSCQVIIRISSNLSYNAKELIQSIAPIIKGGGGGKKEMAQAGGKNPSGLTDALQTLKKIISNASSTS